MSTQRNNKNFFKITTYIDGYSAIFQVDRQRAEPEQNQPYANNKGADQPVHLRSLISAFVVRCLDSISKFQAST